jgi:hypothetical protein
MHGKTLGVPTSKQGKEVSVNTCAQILSFLGTAPRSPDLNPLDSWLSGNLKALVYSAQI